MSSKQKKEIKKRLIVIGVAIIGLIIVAYFIVGTTHGIMPII